MADTTPETSLFWYRLEDLWKRAERFWLGDPPDWTIPIAAVTGTFGIVSGYSLFLLWAQTPRGQDGALMFIKGLIAAAAMSFLFEMLRSTIEGSHHIWSRSRVVTTIVMLAAFELFIIAAHGMGEMKWDEVVESVTKIFGPTLPTQLSAEANVRALGFLWIVVAMVIAFRLRKFIRRWPYPNSGVSQTEVPGKSAIAAGPDIRRGVRAGLISGVVWGPLMAVGYVFVIRAISFAQWIHDNPGWLVPQGAHEGFFAVFINLIAMVSALVAVFARYFGAWGVPLGLLVASGIAVAVVPKENRDVAAVLPSLAFLFVLGLPMLTSPEARTGLGRLALLAALIWGVPAMLLGGLAPLLRRPASSPPIWGFVASAAALVLTVITLVRFFAANASDPEKISLLLATGGAILLSLALFRGNWVEEFWLLLALSVGMICWGTTAVVQNANLLEVQRNAHLLIGVQVAAVEKTALDDPGLLNSIRVAPSSSKKNVPRASEGGDTTSEQMRQAQALELAMTSSLGFWLTIGMLAIWRLSDPEAEEKASE